MKASIHSLTETVDHLSEYFNAAVASLKNEIPSLKIKDLHHSLLMESIDPNYFNHSLNMARYTLHPIPVPSTPYNAPQKRRLAPRR